MRVRARVCVCVCVYALCKRGDFFIRLRARYPPPFRTTFIRGIFVVRTPRTARSPGNRYRSIAPARRSLLVVDDRVPPWSRARKA